jgi:CspA family cold shock protein
MLRGSIYQKGAVGRLGYHVRGTRIGTVIRGLGVSQDAMAKGTVDFFNDTGGYGFIDTEDEDEDVFFHMEDVGGPDLEEGQEVEFDIEQADKGPRATNVTRL